MRHVTWATSGMIICQQLKCNLRELQNCVLPQIATAATAATTAAEVCRSVALCGGCRSVLVLQNVDGAKIRKPCSNRFQWVYREFKKMRYCEFWEQRAHYQGRIWLCWMFTWAEISTIFFRVCSNEYRFTIPFTHEMIHSLYTCLNFFEGIHDELRPRDSILQNRVLCKTGTLIVPLKP